MCQLRIISDMAKISRIRRLKMVIFCKNSDVCAPPVTKLIEMAEEKSVTINCGTYFCILKFCIKSL